MLDERWCRVNSARPMSRSERRCRYDRGDQHHLQRTARLWGVRLCALAAGWAGMGRATEQGRGRVSLGAEGDAAGFRASCAPCAGALDHVAEPSEGSGRTPSEEAQGESRAPGSTLTHGGSGVPATEG